MSNLRCLELPAEELTVLTGVEWTQAAATTSMLYGQERQPRQDWIARSELSGRPC